MNTLCIILPDFFYDSIPNCNLGHFFSEKLEYVRKYKVRSKRIEWLKEEEDFTLKSDFVPSIGDTISINRFKSRFSQKHCFGFLAPNVNFIVIDREIHLDEEDSVVILTLKIK